ncbi:hypothetical protein M527_04735 [Sphingobium indicum IP26]|uniref:Phasin domain-containing protein n=2 Tax=Sphingobium indicum TaxID=332055 RepID=A0A8E0WVS9_9SPHN|nr:hypothetical protein M527_02850 [Sphingobium indicum IP26]EPR11394.1 hypothetical protein M527_04735 [Sphingobium indicum IP26]KER38164.1 hypothetical protein AL00_02210 [Sphingobium indicum F2]
MQAEDGRSGVLQAETRDRRFRFPGSRISTLQVVPCCSAATTRDGEKAMADDGLMATDFWNTFMETQLAGAAPSISIVSELVSSAQGAAGQFVQQCQREALRLASRRLEADMTLVGELGTAQSPGDLVAAWTDFLSQAAFDYSGAIGRMMKLEIDEAALVTNAVTGDDLRDIGLSAQLVA